MFSLIQPGSSTEWASESLRKNSQIRFRSKVGVEFLWRQEGDFLIVDADVGAVYVLASQVDSVAICFCSW